MVHENLSLSLEVVFPCTYFWEILNLSNPPDFYFIEHERITNTLDFILQISTIFFPHWVTPKIFWLIFRRFFYTPFNEPLNHAPLNNFFSHECEPNDDQTVTNHFFSYLILAPGPMQTEKDIKKAAGICLESVKLDPENYRLGHTKARKYFHFSISFHTQIKSIESWKNRWLNRFGLILNPSTTNFPQTSMS